ncbi:hypothetical protein LIER_35964 [Lithospermum erythrorhizon]|uniref:Integrase zinc-binding domain-containing protein n=1 Tax=Lithospermum erythrorhizon TaxID=34254 RepID=A0AAV3P0D5_LITER
MYGNDLYKKSWDGPLLRCVSQENIPKILAEVHQGWCESHIRGWSLAVKITRIGYFWPTLVRDATNFLKRTTLSHASRETPSSLVYGSEAVLPAEVGLPTYRQIGFNEEKNDQ